MHHGCIRWRTTGREAARGGRGRGQAFDGAGGLLHPRDRQNHEEYLSGHGESPGRWYGAGAASLGQRGEASTEAFRRIFEGRHPDTGELAQAITGARLMVEADGAIQFLDALGLASRPRPGS
jgi:hypothetical protein